MEVQVKPVVTPEVREKQMIALAVDEAERRIIDHTASSQIICHYLKLATMREQAEIERIRQQTELLAAKKQDIERGEENERIYAEAIAAMKSYQGHPDQSDTYDEDLY